MVTTTILVGVDGSDGSRRALQWAGQHALQTGAAVIAAHVLTYDVELFNDLPPIGFTTWRDRLRQRLRTDWTVELRSRDVPHRCLLVEGDSVSGTLLHIAEDEHVELVVVGAQGHGSLTHRLLGATTYKLTHATRLPVVVVPAEWTPDG